MENSLLEKWEKIYYFAIEISNFEPWDRFNEDDRIVYMNQKKHNFLLQLFWRVLFTVRYSLLYEFG